jgi:hypothetical protein
MAEIQQADLRSRRFALVCVAVAAVGGAAALVLLESHRQSLISWFQSSSFQAQVSVLVAVLLLLLAPLFLMAAWVWSLGVRVLRGNRHPPEGVKVIRDTPVSRGAAARLYGRLYQGLAALFVLAGLSILGLLWMVWHLQ